MTPNAFRKLALQFHDVIESKHMQHPDFRVGGKIFATLGYPTEEFATIMPTPEEQAQFVNEGGGAFVPVKGGWGMKGSTNVCLRLASPALVKKALAAAWARKASKPKQRSGAPRDAHTR